MLQVACRCGKTCQRARSGLREKSGHLRGNCDQNSHEFCYTRWKMASRLNPVWIVVGRVALAGRDDTHRLTVCKDGKIAEDHLL